MNTAEEQDGCQQQQSPRAPRTNLLLAATIDGDFGKAAVRIRNLSESGAMLEGGAQPRAGERLMLRRGDLAIACSVVWTKGNRCGVRFDCRVSVAQWASGVGLPSSPAAAPTPAKPPPPSRSTVAASEVDGHLADEIGYVVRLLQAIEDQLADEPLVVRRYAGVLQNFDLAAQILGHLATVLSSGDKQAAIEAIGMTELRARLLRRANF